MAEVSIWLCLLEQVFHTCMEWCNTTLLQFQQTFLQAALYWWPQSLQVLHLVLTCSTQNLLFYIILTIIPQQLWLHTHHHHGTHRTNLYSLVPLPCLFQTTLLFPLLLLSVLRLLWHLSGKIAAPLTPKYSSHRSSIKRYDKQMTFTFENADKIRNLFGQTDMYQSMKSTNFFSTGQHLFSYFLSFVNKKKHLLFSHSFQKFYFNLLLSRE